MFDAKRLLDQVMGSGQGNNQAGGLGGNIGGDLGRIARDVLGGGAAPTGGSGGGGNGGSLMTGALAGGVVGLLLGNKKARKMLGQTAGTALKVGGLAAIAGLAYTAWQRRQNTAAVSAPPGQPMLPPPDSPFATANAPGGEDALARAVLVAMIQGAKADGHIDAAEQERIFAQVRVLELDAAAKAFVMDELAAPLDIERVVAAASSPAVAAELYAASLLAMEPDAPAERAYLQALATRLRLDPALAAEIEREVAAAM